MWGRSLFLCFLFVCQLFADIQDSLFEKALDAESAGNIPSTIALLEEAYSYDGNYNAEIKEILNSYYKALQINDSIQQMNVNFIVKAEEGGFNYTEYGNSLSAKEKYGKTFFSLGMELGFRKFNGISKFLLLSISSDLFFREKETVFDTSRWAFSPSIEYTIQGKHFFTIGGLESSFSEKESSIYSLYVSFEKDFYYVGYSRAGISLFSLVNSDLRARLNSGLYFEYKPEYGIWTSFSLAAVFNRDSSVCGYFEHEMFPDTSFVNSVDSYGLQENSVYEKTENVVLDKYYISRRVRFGPEAKFQLGFDFSSSLSFDLLGVLAALISPYNDNWQYFENSEDFVMSWVDYKYRRRLIMGMVRLKADYSRDYFGIYCSFGSHFERYLKFPENHPELISNAYILNEIRFGFSLKF